jgi:hypothetical protein
MDHGPLVIRMNLVRYQALLEKETDEKRRETLQRLIADYEAKLPRVGRLSHC